MHDYYYICADGKFGLSEFDRFRKKWTAGANENSHVNVRRGSLDRRTSYSTNTCNSGIFNSANNSADNRYSWSSDEYIVDGFRPVTLTVNGFFKQVYLFYSCKCNNIKIFV